MRRRRVSRSAEEWKEIVGGWRPGKQSQSAYCGERGVVLSSFIRWRAKLDHRHGGKRSDAFVAMGPVALAGAAQPAAVLRFPDGARVELSRVPDPEWVREVLRS